MGPAIIYGDPPDIAGANIASSSGTIPLTKGGGERTSKACGLVMIDSVLYGLVRNLNLPGQPEGTGSSLTWSADYGRMWTWESWNWPEIGYPVWLNAGQNYAAAKDSYAYLISPDGPSAYVDYHHLLLARVPVGHIREKGAYRFYAGTDSAGNPTWGDYRSRESVFSNPAGCFRPSIVYNPGLDRYLLTMLSPYGTWRWWANENRTRQAHLGVYEAVNPWGPWHVVAYIRDWGAPENRFQPHVPSKWIGADGTSFYLLYSCIPNGPYQFNIQKCTLQRRNIHRRRTT
jgi:hypothetical protein